MKILVDTCIWSQALRRKVPDKDIIKRLSDLISDGRAVLIAPIEQELLSGVSNTSQFNKLKQILSSFEEIQVRSGHYVKAAEFCNTCRAKGIQGSSIDFLICSVAHGEKMIIYTTDKDFENYAQHLPIQLMT